MPDPIILDVYPLKSLCRRCSGVRLLVMELVVASSPPCLDCVRVLHLDSMNSLTDASLQALAQAGCGKNLTSLTSDNLR